MFLRPCVTVKATFGREAFGRLEHLVALQSVPSASFACISTSFSLNSYCLKNRVSPVSSHSPVSDLRSMPWAGQVACNSNHNLLHLNGLRKGLAASQRLASHLAPYVGGATILSAGSFCLQRQQARQSRRRNALPHDAAVVEMRAPVDINQGNRASSSSSDSDADLAPGSGTNHHTAASDK